MHDLRSLVVSDLLRAQRLIRRIGDEIDPQFRIASPEGDQWIGLTLPDDDAERKRRLGLLSDYMAWWLSPGFIMAAELAHPDAVFCCGVTARERAWCTSRITRQPLSFGEIEWQSNEILGDEVPGLLPTGRRWLSEKRIEELKEWFGPQGKFPAVFLDDIGRLGRGTEEFGSETLSKLRH